MTTETPAEREAALERGRRLFAQPCTFLWAADDADQLPPADLPEVAFAGDRKSTRLNSSHSQQSRMPSSA